MVITICRFANVKAKTNTPNEAIFTVYYLLASEWYKRRRQLLFVLSVRTVIPGNKIIHCSKEKVQE